MRRHQERRGTEHAFVESLDSNWGFDPDCMSKPSSFGVGRMGMHVHAWRVFTTIPNYQYVHSDNLRLKKCNVHLDVFSTIRILAS